jgi:Fe-S-cluster-containing dehydrogenase component
MLTRVTRDGQSITAEPSKCAGCITCMLRCSFRIDSKFNLSHSRIRVERQSGRADEFAVSFSADCDACLTCARYCPYGALTTTKEVKEKMER